MQDGVRLCAVLGWVGPWVRLGWSTPGLSNLLAMAGRIDFILGLAGHYAISAAVKAMFECMGGAPIGAGGYDPPLLEAKTGGYNLGIIPISHIALITPLH